MPSFGEANAVKVEARGGGAHDLDGVSEPYNGGTRHARCADAKSNEHLFQLFPDKRVRSMFKLFLYNVGRWCFVWETNTAVENAIAVKNGSPLIRATIITNVFARGRAAARPAKN